VSAPRLAILGPTASNKSELALEVARRTGGTVVNGDPFQALRGLAIGTGQPSPEDLAAVPHLGYGVLPLDARPNPATFGALVRTWLDAVPAPVLVTGSGLYLRGIWDQLTELPEVPGALRDRVRRWVLALGAPALHRYLAAVDPVRAAQLHPNDTSRIQRALALHLATGRAPSALLEGVPREIPEGWRALLVLPGRDRAKARVTRRVAAMLRAGWPAEVQAAREAGFEADLRELRPLGYVPLLDGGPGARALVTAQTQAYAKRQATWFRNQWPGIPRWDPDTQTLEEALALLLDPDMKEGDRPFALLALRPPSCSPT
jgi:tRNA dimethylallyltransferase